MREILFEGKRLDNGEWVEGDLLHLPHGVVILKNGYANVDPETVGQYTGRKDRYNKRIFEGNVVDGYNTLHERRERYVITWVDNGFYFVDDSETDWHPEFVIDMVVIGNIHDHPEWLEGE